MTADYEILLQGNNLRLREGFLGLANVSLIHTAQGPMLFDVGHYVNRDGLLTALAARDLAPADIPFVFLSHLHFDHSLNIDLFPEAKVFVSRREWDYAAEPHEKDAFTPKMIRAQLESHNLELLDGEPELFPGIRTLAVPGHTPGSYALDLDTPDKGRVVIAGDAIKYPKEVIGRRCDMAFDTLEAGTRSIERILAIAERIVPGHFPEMVRQPDGTFLWQDAASFELLVR